MTKEEIANIKRIDTSLNVFRKKMEAVDVKIKKLTEPLIEEKKDLKAEIDFWERPVIERYGKTTTELLKEAGEETASDINSEEAKETVNEPGIREEKEDDAPGTDAFPAEEAPESEGGLEDLPVDLPEEWK